MEDAAGVVRRIILLWCEVIIPPCPPSLSSSLVYLWLAAVCECVRGCPFLSPHTHCKFAKQETWRNTFGICVFLYCCQGAPNWGTGRTCVFLLVHQNVKGVALVWVCVSVCLDWSSCCVCINSSTLSIKSSFPALPSPPMTQNKAEHPVLHYMHRDNTTAMQQQPQQTATTYPHAAQRNWTRGWSREAPHSCRPPQSEIRCIFVWQDKREKANILQGSKFYIYSSFWWVQ